MHRYETGEQTGGHTAVHHLSHLNTIFTGRGSRVYDVVMVRLTANLYRYVVEDMASLGLEKGNVLDAGTGPGTLARLIARRFPGMEVEGIDLSEDMILVAREHTRHEQLEERVHFVTGNVGKMPYGDDSFDLVVSTISLHHWDELEQPLRELYRVLRPGGRLWIYDFRFVKAQTIERAMAGTPFAVSALEQRVIRTSVLPFAFYQRFALRK